jgi:hypothetical protein
VSEPASDRQRLAEDFLREAVYRSRAAQAAGVALRSTGGGSGCGLGERAGVVLDLSPRAADLFALLWPQGTSSVDALRERMQRWVERQDALDRKRNHFLKAFRQEHGFDRTRYTQDEVRAFEDGLAEINAEEDQLRVAAAAELLAS